MRCAGTVLVRRSMRGELLMALRVRNLQSLPTHRCSFHSNYDAWLSSDPSLVHVRCFNAKL